MITRVRGRDAFHRLRRDGVRARVGPLWCSYVHDADMSVPGVAFAIGRASGPAVVRNRLRRRLRAILRDAEVPPGFLLVGSSPSASELTFAQLASTVHQLLTRVERAS